MSQTVEVVLSRIIEIPTPYLILIITSIISLAIYTKFFYDPRRRHLPPGPKGWPIIGNSFQIDFEKNPAPQLVKWTKQYGEIFYLSIGGSDFVFLNSGRVVRDLMEKRGTIYSDKPDMPMAEEAYSKGLNLSMMHYNQRWKTHRKLLQGMLTPKQAETFRPIQEFESKQMAVDWLDSPQDYYQHTRRYAFSLIMQITYGRRFPKFGSKDAEGVYEANKHFATVATPGAYLVDTFPILAKIPGYGTIFGTWRKVAEELFQMDSQAFLGYYRRMKDELKRGVGHPCFARDLEQIDEEHGIDELERAYLAIGLVQPGAESTAALLNWLVRALATWPEVQIDARKELDRVIGFDRTPNWEDEQQLPYLRAMVKELLRWALGTKFGVPHRLTKDDWYEGMFIPKGTRVVLGQCGLHYDDQRYPEPWRYNPSRYLGTKMLQKSAYENMFSPNYEEDRDHWGYGAGRRYCPGIHVAEKSLYINIAKIMWGFDIQKPDGEDWKAFKVEDGLFSIPKNADVKIQPRSQKHADIMRREWVEAQKEGLHYSPAPRELLTKKS